MNKIYIFLILFLTLTLGLTTQVLAEAPNEGFYIGLSMPYVNIEGDFDGDSSNWIRDTEIEYYLYEHTAELGQGILFGFYNESYAFEISYSLSEHDYSWDTISGKMRDGSELQLLNATIKKYKYFSNNKNAVYGLIGYGTCRFSVKDNVIDYNSNEIDDATYYGSGYHLGIGWLYRINNKIALDCSLVYQRMIMDEIKAFDIEWSLPEEVLMVNEVATVSIKYYIK